MGWSRLYRSAKLKRYRAMGESVASDEVAARMAEDPDPEVRCVVGGVLLGVSASSNPTPGGSPPRAPSIAVDHNKRMVSHTLGTEPLRQTRYGSKSHLCPGGASRQNRCGGLRLVGRPDTRPAAAARSGRLAAPTKKQAGSTEAGGTNGRTSVPSVGAPQEVLGGLQLEREAIDRHVRTIGDVRRMVGRYSLSDPWCPPIENHDRCHT